MGMLFRASNWGPASGKGPGVRNKYIQKKQQQKKQQQLHQHQQLEQQQQQLQQQPPRTISNEDI